MTDVYSCGCGCKFFIIERDRSIKKCPCCLIRTPKRVNEPPIIRRKIVDVIELNPEVAKQIEISLAYLRRHYQVS